MARPFKPLALAAARAASGKKGEAITLLHVSRRSPITDYMLIVTANSRPHLESLESEIDKAAEGLGLSCLHHSKPKSDQWRVLDFGGLLVHIMTAETRDFYSLDKLYSDSPRITWESDHSHGARPKAGAASRKRLRARAR